MNPSLRKKADKKLANFLKEKTPNSKKFKALYSYTGKK